MLEARIPFTSQDLVLLSADDVKPKVWEELVEKASALSVNLFRDLNARELGSVTRRFNDADVGFPVELPAHAWDFLQVNLNAIKNSKLELNPFAPHIVSMVELNSALHLDQAHRIVKKLLPLQLNSSDLLPLYVVDMVADMLIDQGSLNSFCLIYKSMYLGLGEWEVELKHPHSDQDIVLTINNQAILLEPQKSELLELEDEVSDSPFAQPRHAPKHTGVIVEAGDLLTARQIAAAALPLADHGHLQTLAREHNVGLTLLLPDEEIIQFS